MFKRSKTLFFLSLLMFFGATSGIKKVNAVEYDYMSKCVKDLLTKAQQVAAIEDKTVLQKKQQLIYLLAPYFLFDWNAKMAIGRPFQDLTEDEKKIYINEYSKYFLYVWLAELYYDQRNGTKVNIHPISKKINEKDGVVDIDVISPDGKKYNISLRVRKDEKNNQFHILNMVVEGVDIAMSYRSQFASYIESHNGKANSIIKYLEEKNEKYKKTSGLSVPFK